MNILHSGIMISSSRQFQQVRFKWNRSSTNEKKTHTQYSERERNKKKIAQQKMIILRRMQREKPKMKSQINRNHSFSPRHNQHNTREREREIAVLTYAALSKSYRIVVSLVSCTILSRFLLTV